MKVIYTGVHKDLPPKIRERMDRSFSKLGKLLDGRGEHKAHVIVKKQRSVHKAEVTLHFHDHQFVGTGSDADLAKAMTAALLKLEAQAVKQKSKFREKTRRKEAPKRVARETPAGPEPTATSDVAVKRIRLGRRKPMSLEEAILAMEDDIDYVLYRDVESETLSVLIRRRDGGLDLIET